MAVKKCCEMMSSSAGFCVNPFRYSSTGWLSAMIFPTVFTYLNNQGNTSRMKYSRSSLMSRNSGLSIPYCTSM